MPARRAMDAARWFATRAGAGRVSSMHLLFGITQSDDGASEMLARHGIDSETIRSELGLDAPVIARIGAVAPLPLAEDSQRVIELAAREAELGRFPTSSTAPMVLGILRATNTEASRVLARHGITLSRARTELAARRPAGEPSTDDRRSASERDFVEDLTAAAADGRLDPLIGRQPELEETMMILLRRTKCNPILIGDAGVGKTALVEGLATRIAEGDVTGALADKRLLALDLPALIAGTRYRGEFEERLRGVLDDFGSRRDSILFIDEVHTLVGAGSAEGTLDAANILKPRLSRGDLSCIGATTLREYRLHIEQDRALARRFQAVRIDPPDRGETLDILAGLKPRYEEFHGVTLADGALRAAVELTDRFVPDRHMPDKAIDIIDRAAARARLLAPDTGPEEGDGDEAQRISADNVSEAVARMTGIPVSRLSGDESERLLGLERSIQRQVVGQEAAISTICRAIRRSRMGIADPRRPIGSFLLAGPSGVGKSAIARALAAHLFGVEEALVRFDMSEYMERHAVAKLIGSPPGYVGYEDGGRLSETVRNRPYCIVLFEDVDKAHPDVADLFLQLLEDGRLTDSDGRVVDFSNCLVLMTTNVGTDLLAQAGGIGFGKESSVELSSLETEITAELKRAFKSEVVNRFDELVVFNALGTDHLKQIIDLLLGDLQDRLSGREVEIEVTDRAKDWILEKAEVSVWTGARPLRQALERWLYTAIAEELIARSTEPVHRITADVEDGELIVLPDVDAPTDSRRSTPEAALTH